MKNLITTSVTTLLLAVPALSASFTTSTTIGASSSNPNTLTGIDIDGDSLADVEFTYSYDETSTGSTFNTLWVMGNGSSITWDNVAVTGFTDVSSTLDINSVAFSEFTGFNYSANFADQNSTIQVNGGQTYVENDRLTYTAVTSGTSLEVATISGGNMLLSNLTADFVIDYDVTTVPEPSSAALLGLGALALVSRRKR